MLKYYKLKWQRQKKKYEQLNIGKIKFELVPIYYNKTYLTFLITTNNTFIPISTLPTSWSLKKKLLLLIGLLSLIYISFFLFIHTYTPLCTTHPSFNNIITPLIFNIHTNYNDLILTKLF